MDRARSHCNKLQTARLSPKPPLVMENRQPMGMPLGTRDQQKEASQIGVTTLSQPTALIILGSKTRNKLEIILKQPLERPWALVTSVMCFAFQTSCGIISMLKYTIPANAIRDMDILRPKPSGSDTNQTSLARTRKFTKA